MLKTTKLAIGAGIIGMAYGSFVSAAPSPGAIAESLLTVSNFTLRQSGGGIIAAENVNCVPAPMAPCDLNVTGVTSNGDTSSTLNGITDEDDAEGFAVGTLFDITSYVGSNPLDPTIDFTPGVIQVGDPAATFVAGASSTSGNAIENSDDVIVHSVSVINGTSGTSSGNSNQGLQSTTFIISPSADIDLEMTFDAYGYLRSGIGQGDPGNSADANYSWSLSIDVVDPTSGDLVPFLSWTPDGDPTSGLSGLCFGLGTCSELADSFDLTDQISTISGIPNDFDRASTDDGSLLPFGVEASFSAGGIYNITLDHITAVNSTVRVVPEPATVALMGLGLLGAGAARRRKS